MDSLLHFFFFSSRRRHTRFDCDWSSDVCSSDLRATAPPVGGGGGRDGGRAPAHGGAVARLVSARGRRGRRAGPPPGRGRARAAAEPGAAGGEIGRASCRERGEISVVAGAVTERV